MRTDREESDKSGLSLLTKCAVDWSLHNEIRVHGQVCDALILVIQFAYLLVPIMSQ